MEKILVLSILTVFWAGMASPTMIEEQTSWYQGPGVIGPVDHWGNHFYVSGSLAYSLPGELVLQSSAVNYDDWIRHSIKTDPSIESHATFLPADINGDGYTDLVGLTQATANNVLWFEKKGASILYEEHIAGSFNGGSRATIWPFDMDGDGRIDIVASGTEGLVWFKNSAAGFTKYSIDTSVPYLYARPADLDNDGDIDIVVHDLSIGFMYGDLFLFRNDGSMHFTRELIWDATDMSDSVWRINIGDFNGDGFPDIQTSGEPIYVFLNDGTGRFTKSFEYIPPPTYFWGVDGSWPNDFDADGDMDIMVAHCNGPLSWLENIDSAGPGTGTGTDFKLHEIGGNTGNYGDGGMATDLNLDGRMDALGIYIFAGWFEQLADGTFQEHVLPDGFVYDSHWVYGENIDGDICSGDVDVDILATLQGELVLWENRMITFADSGWLESSIFDAGGRARWLRFGWEDCVPAGASIRYRVRSGSTEQELLGRPWSKPIAFSGDKLSRYKIPQGDYFQYRTEVEKTGAPANLSPIVYKVWVEYSLGHHEDEDEDMDEAPDEGSDEGFD
jgi:hypothetical protein